MVPSGGTTADGFGVAVDCVLVDVDGFGFAPAVTHTGFVSWMTES